MVYDEKFANVLFSTFVTKGERVNAGDLKTITVYPLKRDQTCLGASLHFTDAYEPVYIDDDGVVKLAEIEIELPGTGWEREVEISFAFGNTEIDVQLRDPRDGGDIAGTKIDFLVE